MASRRDFFRAMAGLPRADSAGRHCATLGQSGRSEPAVGPDEAGDVWRETRETLDLLAEGLPSGPSGSADADFAAAAGPLLSALAEICSARAALGGTQGAAVAAAVHADALVGLQAVLDLDAGRAEAADGS